MTQTNDVNTWMDEMLRVVSGIGVIVDVAVLIAFGFALAHRLIMTTQIPEMFSRYLFHHDEFDFFLLVPTLCVPILLPLVAMAAYYLLWFSIPLFVGTISLYLQIYIMMPAIVIFQAWVCYKCFFVGFPDAVSRFDNEARAAKSN